MEKLSHQEQVVVLRKIIDHHWERRSKIPRRLAKEFPGEAAKLDQLLPPPRVALREPCMNGCGRPRTGHKYCRDCADIVTRQRARNALPKLSKEQRRAAIEQRRKYKAEKYRELIEGLRRGESQQDWADRLGSSRQAINQIYRKYEGYLS